MIGFLIRLARFATQAKWRGDHQAYRFAQKLIWETQNRLDHFKTTGPLQLPSIELTNLVGELQMTMNTADFTSEDGSTDPYETWCIAAICRRLNPKTIFEIGTYKGQTTRLLAQQAQQAKIYSLDLPATQIETLSIVPTAGDLRYLSKSTLGEYLPAGLLGDRVTLLNGDSTTYDYSPYLGKCDLVFVDAAHSYPFVKSDTENAFRLIHKRSVILWHDYKPGCPGVVKALHETSTHHHLVHIRKTSLVVYGLEPPHNDTT